MVEAVGTVKAHGIDAFPRYFTFQVLDPDLPYVVALHVHTVQGKLNPSAATGAQVAPLPGDDLSRPLPSIESVLARMQVDDFVADAVGVQVALYHKLRYEDLLSPDREVRTAALANLQAGVDVAEGYRPRRYSRRGRALLEEVARIYIAAMEAGEHPTRAVKERVEGGPNGYSTAAAWVSQARAAGLLPPAIKGRPGWVEENKA